MLVVLFGVTDILDGEVEAADGTFGGGGGDGSVGNPYLIEDVSDLQAMNAGLSDHYVLVNDIDASATGEWNNGSGFDPVGFDDSHFTGSLDGKGHWITDLFINRTSEGRVALFGFVGVGGSISNVNLGNVSISGNQTVGGLMGWSYGTVVNVHITGSISAVGDNVGGIVGINHDNGTLNNCSFAGTVQGGQSVGGLAGSSSYAVEDSHSSGTVTGSGHVGGLIGYNVGKVQDSYSTSKVTGWTFVGGLLGATGSTVQDSYAIGDVSGNSQVGGLVGSAFDTSMIQDCLATGDVDGSETVGGLVGYGTGTVQASRATGDVSGHMYVGGLVGTNRGSVSNSYSNGKVIGDATSVSVGGLVGSNRGTISNCLATSDVNGHRYVGGLAAYNDYTTTISNSYSTGKVVGNELVGGLVGKNSNDPLVNNSFWDTQTSGHTTSSWGIAENTTNMKMKTTFTDSGWDFNDTWDIVEGQSYPYLQAFSYAPLIATEDVEEILEDETYSVSYAADVFPLPGKTDTPSLQWKLNSNVGWVNMSSGGVLSGTPTNDEVGSYWVNVSVSDDNGGLNYRHFWLTVVNTNDPPVVQTSALPNGTGGKAYSLDLTAIDVDGDPLVWSVETNASWLTVKPGTATLQGTPSGAGNYWVRLTADDNNGGTDSVNLTLTVLPGPDGDDDDGGFIPGFGAALLVVGIVVSMGLYRRKKSK